jgi:hypothetical protein
MDMDEDEDEKAQDGEGDDEDDAARESREGESPFVPLAPLSLYFRSILRRSERGQAQALRDACRAHADDAGVACGARGADAAKLYAITSTSRVNES